MNSTKFQIVVFFAFFLAAAALLAKDTNENPLEYAKTLIDTGKAKEAYKLLKPYQPKLEGEPAFDYIYGLAALDAGRTVEAIFALERVVDKFPNHGPARGELAKAYLALGETDDAKKEFEKVKEMGNLPPEAQQTIDRYLSGIELFHDRTRLTWRPWISVGLGYDTNINGATDEKTLTIPIAPGLPFSLGGTQNSPILNGNIGLSVSKPITEKISLFGSGTIGGRHTTHKNDFTSHTASGRAGIRIEKEKQAYSLTADASMLRLDAGGIARADRKTAGISGEWQYALSEKDLLSTFFQMSAIRNPKQSIRDVNRAMVGINYGHVFADMKGTPILFSSAFFGVEDERVNRSADHLGKHFWGGRLGASYQFSEKHTVFSAVTYQISLYETGDPVFLVRRNDSFFDFNVGYRFQVNKHLSFSPTAVYNNNDSNIVTSDYDRFEFLLTARYDF